ncbi:MAG: UpxY family transcription antiterminator [Prolixibacteraceae bacterium]|nr:UpxY family transcription antiterminator [Prolixibacteraceae bacterium]
MSASQKYWYAVYTKSRAEKKVQLELEFQGIEHYLPLQSKLRQWSDRKKWVEVPLIPGYIFVQIDRFDYDRVLRTANVVSYVRFEGKAAIIPNEQIDLIRRMLRDSSLEIEVSMQNFSEGDVVEVMAGPLTGIQGKLVSFKGKKRVAIELEQLNLSLTVTLPLNEIRKI